MASISYKASMTMTNRYGFNGGNEYEDEGELNYSNTFYRKYDAQIGRFTGVDMLAEQFASINPYQFGFNNPVIFNDPMGDKALAGGSGRKNAADFKNVRDLLDYIQNNGIGNFDDEFNNWTFGGGGDVTGYGSGNAFKYSKDGSSVIFSWYGEKSDGQRGEFGTYSNLNTVVAGTSSMKIQRLWDYALSWGETHRNVSSKAMYGAAEHYDVMDAHNYSAFRKRLSGNMPLSRSGDRKSYTENLERFKGRYAREQDARNFEMGFVGTFMAPVAIYGLAEAGVIGFISNGVSSVAGTINAASFDAGASIYFGLNNLRNTVGIGAAMYFSKNSSTYGSLMKWAEGTFSPTNSERLLNFRDNYQTFQFYLPFLPQIP